MNGLESNIKYKSYIYRTPEIESFLRWEISLRILAASVWSSIRASCRVWFYCLCFGVLLAFRGLRLRRSCCPHFVLTVLTHIRVSNNMWVLRPPPPTGSSLDTRSFNIRIYERFIYLIISDDNAYRAMQWRPEKCFLYPPQWSSRLI